MMMIRIIFFGLLLLVWGIGVVLGVYLLIQRYTTRWMEAAAVVAATEEEEKERGSTEEELVGLEEGKVGAGDGAECAVCLEEMVEGQTMRVLPGCRHAFHRPCADAWLRVYPTCPLCRARLLPDPHHVGI